MHPKSSKYIQLHQKVSLTITVILGVVLEDVMQLLELLHENRYDHIFPNIISYIHMFPAVSQVYSEHPVLSELLYDALQLLQFPVRSWSRAAPGVGKEPGGKASQGKEPGGRDRI